MKVVMLFKSQWIRMVVYIGLFAILSFLYTVLLGSFFSTNKLTMSVQQNEDSTYQLFFANKDQSFSSERCIDIPIKGSLNYQKIETNIPDKNYEMYRIDVGDKVTKPVQITEISIGNFIYKKTFDVESMINTFKFINIDSSGIKKEKSSIIIEASHDDPQIVVSNPDASSVIFFRTMSIACVLSFITVFIIHRYIKLKSILYLFVNLFNNRRLILTLAINDFKTKYAGSYFGIVWAFLQPVFTVLTFWFVFQVGFRSTPLEGVPFILWLICGLIPWFYFSEAWSSSTNVFMDYSYLVKKVVFDINILPIVKIVSALFVHLFFIAFMIFIFVLYGYYPNWYTLQLLYYSFCLFMLVVGLGFITSSLIVFFKDIGQIIPIVLQFGMWLTPILWNIEMIPPKFKWIFKLNPMYYIVNGYRETMINRVGFYMNIKQTFCFWIVVSIIILIGALLYRRLKPHFADVL